jgi:hypothetical protein
MIWLTWRQFRIPGAALFGWLAALAMILAITGPGMANDYAQGIASCANTPDGCTLFIRRFFAEHTQVFLAVSSIVLILPALIGLFWGAPLISREVETGTHRMIWNQSITRTRWLIVKLTMIGVAAMTAGGVASFAVTWWSRTFDQVPSADYPLLASVLFDARGVVPIGYSAFAFVLGVTIGMLVRRTLPAMAVTLVAFAVIQVAMPLFVRPNLLPATETTVELSPTMMDGLMREPGSNLVRIEAKAPDQAGWLLSSQTIDKAGNPVDTITLPPGTCAPPTPTTTPQGHMASCLEQINALGYREQLTYHAPGRFWPFQWMEMGIYLGATVALGGFCVWWLRRRLT